MAELKHKYTKSGIMGDKRAAEIIRLVAVGMTRCDLISHVMSRTIEGIDISGIIKTIDKLVADGLIRFNPVTGDCDHIDELPALLSQKDTEETAIYQVTNAMYFAATSTTDQLTTHERASVLSSLQRLLHAHIERLDIVRADIGIQLTPF